MNLRVYVIISYISEVHWTWYTSQGNYSLSLSLIPSFSPSLSHFIPWRLLFSPSSHRTSLYPSLLSHSLYDTPISLSLSLCSLTQPPTWEDTGTAAPAVLCREVTPVAQVDRLARFLRLGVVAVLPCPEPPYNKKLSESAFCVQITQFYT